MKKSNMYQLSVKQLSLFVGCGFGCPYCEPSFQRLLKRWAKGKCEKCYNYEPHDHLERVQQKLPRTGYMQFIFLCSSGDIKFASKFVLNQIIRFVDTYPNRTFLLQSKAPYTFNRIPNIPQNLILGTTIETDRDDIINAVCPKTPLPYKRFRDFLNINHPLKMVTVEPVMLFNMSVMINWMEQLNPCMIWIGYDSKKIGLPEPNRYKLQNLHWELSRRGFVVILKTIRDRVEPQQQFKRFFP